MKGTKKWLGLIVSLVVVLAAGATLGQQPVGKLPDLTIEKIYLTKDCMVAVVVKNVGPGPVPDSVWTVDTLESTGVHLYTNGSWWSWDSIKRFDSAKNLKSPGGTATCVSTLQVSGAAIIKAVVDRRNVVPEANEDNNSLETKLSCGE